MSENVFDELKRYVDWTPQDEQALQGLAPRARPYFHRIAETFYDRILSHDQARTVLVGGERSVGRLKVTLVAWMERLLTGPWDESYFELRCRIGRMHVRISLPQHYMFGAMNVVRRELQMLTDAMPERAALNKVLDLELAIMLHTYREDLLAQGARHERLSTFGQLVGSIGHELRNPLGVIETSLYLMQKKLPPDEERLQKHVSRIGEQVSIANGIITNLLDIIRDRPLTLAPVRLADVLANAQEALGEHSGRLEFEGLEEVAEVAGDAQQLRQVFVNLLENAVHAAGPEGWVRVSAEPGDDGGSVTLAVEDSGPGVDAEVRRRLFEPLITTKVKGVGLGLALVKRMVERHGGSITYAPREGAGARFVVRLPIATTLDKVQR